MNQEELEKLTPGDMIVFKSKNSYPNVHYGDIFLDYLKQDELNKEFIFIFVSFSDDLLTLFNSEYGICQLHKQFKGLTFMAFLSYIKIVS